MSLKMILRNLGCAALVFSLIACSCTNEALLDNVLGFTAEPPVFSGYSVKSETEIAFNFTKDVNLVNAALAPDKPAVYSANGNSVNVVLKTKAQSGSKYTADIIVEDDNGNTLNVLVPFRTKNARIPKMEISEIRTEAGKPKAEFIEIKILEDGNLGAVSVFASVMSLKEPIYEFPPCEVKKDELIILHTRTYPEIAAKDELLADLTLSVPAESTIKASDIKAIGLDAPIDVRDFWIGGSVKLLHGNDAVFILDQDGKVLDAAVFIIDAAKKSVVVDAMAYLTKKKGWSGEPFCDVKFTTTRTLNRDFSKPKGSADAFYICASSGATPGKVNKP